MSFILNNPYRVIGILAGTSLAAQTSHLNRLRMYLDAEQEPKVDFSFPVLGNLRRTVDSVNEAAAKINLDKDKLEAALFWFYNGNDITDEPAFDALKEADLQSAHDIWSKRTTTEIITETNLSAFLNLSSLLLIVSLRNKEINEKYLKKGIELKLKILESNYVFDYKNLICDAVYQPNKNEIQLIFLNFILENLKNHEENYISIISEILIELSFSTKDIFLKTLTQKPIQQIEAKIEAAKSKRKANKAQAANAGKELYNTVCDDIEILRKLCGTNDLSFNSISDKIADEILQCGIDYFLHYRDTESDPSSATMDLFRKAKSFAVGRIVTQRCLENTENVQEWIDDKPEREKQTRILVDFEKLKNLIDEYEGKSETVSNAKQLLANARPYLNNVKSVLGSKDELYLGLSSRIASDAQGMCVSEINKLQERFSKTYDKESKLTLIKMLKQRVDEAWSVTTTIGSMDLRQDFRTRYTQNKTSLLNLKTQLAGINTGGGGGCYLATMVYGDYDHPQVMILRQFRDEVLDKSALGKWFIKTYYHYSPKLVERLKNERTVNFIIRKALNQFIKLIK
jgi:hypothetical protein